MVAIAAGAGRARGQETIPTWETPAVYSAGAFPFGIDAADAMGPTGPNEDDLDGYPDVAVAAGNVNFLTFLIPDDYTGNPSEVRFFRNSQDWTPTSGGLVADGDLTISLPNNSIAAEVKFADITGDGRNDVVVTATDPFDDITVADWGVYVYAWDGQFHKFVFWQYVESSFPLRGLAVADFDHDGDLDVGAVADAAVDLPGADQASVFLNDDDDDGSFGDGVLGTESMTDLGSPADFSAIALAHGHFQKTPGGSLYPDLVASRWDETVREGALLVGQGDGTFNVTTIAPAESSFAGATGMAVGRFQTGKLYDDLAVMDGSNGELWIYHANGSGAFSNNDGDEPNDIYFDGAGPGPVADFPPRGVASGQVNGGIKIDLVVGGHSQGSGAFVHLLLGLGNKRFEHTLGSTSPYNIPVATASHPVEYPLRVLVADMDLDGFGDVLSSNHGDEYDNGSISIVINAMTTSP